MSKNKLKKFSEMESFERVYQPAFNEVFGKDYFLKGSWAEKVFCNQNPVILELGCGKGEYTVNLAMKYPEINFIGVDIKGARIWKGAKTVQEKGIKNVAFLRTRIEIIDAFFGEDEISEIWITFPDPQLKKRRNKKRLTGSAFLKRYQKFLVDSGMIHLKTDNKVMYEYTKKIASHNGFEILRNTADLYRSDFLDDVLSIKTYYEMQFLSEGSNIHYLEFLLSKGHSVSKPLFDEE